MYIIADKRIPARAAESLSKCGKLILFETNGITYSSISGHPDIFLCKIGNQWVAAPNLPEKFKDELHACKINFIEGEDAVGDKYPLTAGFNAVVTDTHLIHNFRYTDALLSQKADELDLELIHVNQGYCRCNLIALNNTHFITSDIGVEKVLQQNKFEVFYVEPDKITLPGKPHGFFGGCCGVHENNLFVLGSLNAVKNGDQLKQFIVSCKLDIVELYDGPLFDGGSLLFFDD